jgi:hypothetical protein
MPAARPRGLDQQLGQGLVSDVAGDGDGMSPFLLDRRDERVELSLRARSHDDPGALAGEQPCRGVADPGACSGDDANLVGECGHLQLHAS